MKRIAAALALGIALLPVLPGCVDAQGGAEVFTRLTLARGLSLELPVNWMVLSENARTTVRAFGEAVTDREANSSLEFAANLYDDAGATLALMNVRYYPDLDVTQADARAFGAADVQELDAALRESIVAGFASGGIQVSAWHGTNTATMGGLTAFITEYERTSLVGSQTFRARLVRVFADDQSFTLTVSYAVPLGPVLRPITDRVINSLQLTGYPSEAAETAAQSPLTVLYGDAWLLVLALSFVVTWGIGLTPPVIIRYVALKRALGRSAALAIVIGFWVLNVLIFTALGSQSHTALTLVGMVSYWILRRPVHPLSSIDVESRAA